MCACDRANLWYCLKTSWSIYNASLLIRGDRVASEYTCRTRAKIASCILTLIEMCFASIVTAEEDHSTACKEGRKGQQYKHNLLPYTGRRITLDVD